MAERIMLNINHIAKTFNPGTITEKRALTDVDLKLNEGDFVTIIGGNGAGKSTLFKLLTRLYEPTAGEIRFGDENIAGFNTSAPNTPGQRVSGSDDRAPPPP